MKTCQVFFRADVAFVFTQSITKAGIGITTEPMFKVPSSSSNELAEAVLKCLAASKIDVPDPVDYSVFVKQMLRFAKEKSWNRFVAGAILRGVWMLDDKVKIVPFDAAERGSFEQREDLSFECPIEPATEMGRRLIESIA
jgi:hypothetical protein